MFPKKAIVTGGMGFIGKHVVSQLLKEGFQVLVLDNLETAENNKEFEIPIRQIQFGQTPDIIPVQDTAALLRLDLKQATQDQLQKVLMGYPYVFHLAALARVEPSIKDPYPYHITNVDASLKLIAAAKNVGVEKFIFSSSSSVYGDPLVTPTKENSELNPMSPYALHKLICEQYLDLFATLYNFNSVSLRYFNVYGKGQPTKGSYVPVMGIFFRQRKNGQPLTITGDGSQTRDFINVEDVARANVKAALTDLPEGHSKINIASGTNYSLREIAQAISPKLVAAPERFEPHTTLGDISLAKEVIDWEPTINLMEWIEEFRPKN